MKKMTQILSTVLVLLCITSCGVTPTEETDTSEINASETTAALEETTPAEPILEEDVNPESIALNSIEGLNEYIYVNLNKLENTADYRISYRAMEDVLFTELDKELILDEGTAIGCYILGLAKGEYCVKIEQGEGDSYARKTVTDIAVEKQDRSGYAHFKREEGIGGYNNDGTVKDNAVILYVNNENKNTVTLDINGTTYTGLVQILQAKSQMEEPLIVRVTDKIVTNQWKPKEYKNRLADDSNLTEDFFVNTFDTKFGENLANLSIELFDMRLGLIYKYITTPDGIIEVGTQQYRVETTTSEIDGTEVYNDATYTNTIDIKRAKDITIEGVGTTAEFYQFGINFVYCDSIEIKNITFDRYPLDALNFRGNKDGTFYGNYWIHNNTFCLGYNAWALTPDYDEQNGDGSIDLIFAHSVTIAYNKFKDADKVMLVDNGKDVTLHHNLYDGCAQRLPSVYNANVHSYNNLFYNCYFCQSARYNSYYFSEANWFHPKTYKNRPIDYYHEYYMSDPCIKSYKDLYRATTDELTEVATITDDRELVIENSCSPDGITDYSRFDTDSNLFYYDEANKCTDVELMLDTAEMDGTAALEWMKIHVGAGKNVKLDFSEKK